MAIGSVIGTDSSPLSRELYEHSQRRRYNHGGEGLPTNATPTRLVSRPLARPEERVANTQRPGYHG